MFLYGVLLEPVNFGHCLGKPLRGMVYLFVRWCVILAPHGAKFCSGNYTRTNSSDMGKPGTVWDTLIRRLDKYLRHTADYQIANNILERVSAQNSTVAPFLEKATN